MPDTAAHAHPHPVANSPPRTVVSLLLQATTRLRNSGVEAPRLDAELLLASAAGRTRSWLLTNRDEPIASDAARRFGLFLERRCRREPSSRILGQREFWSHMLTVTPDVLDPRADSETLIDAALGVAGESRNDDLTVADLGTGSGCLLLALLAELPRARGIGVDREGAAVAVARRNAERVGLDDRASFVVADWGAPFNRVFDLVVCNPPYLSTNELETCQPDVRYDPVGALDGGRDGLDAYRVVVPQLHELLSGDGWAILEIGHTQADAVCAMAGKAGLRIEAIGKDLAGRDRCIIASGEGN